MIDADPMVIAIAVLVAAAGLGLGVASWWRARQQAVSGSRIELLTSRYLGGKKVLSLVEVEGERLLLALSGNSVRLVARFRPGQDRGARREARARAPHGHIDQDLGNVPQNLPLADPAMFLRGEAE